MLLTTLRAARSRKSLRQVVEGYLTRFVGNAKWGTGSRTTSRRGGASPAVLPFGDSPADSVFHP
jgi:hypothetical protein